jgi:hypothetical protein
MGTQELEAARAVIGRDEMVGEVADCVVDGGVEVRELFGGEEVVAIEAIREVVVG